MSTKSVSRIVTAVLLAGLVFALVGGPRGRAQAQEKPQTLGVLLYTRFEPLDVFGPVEVFGNVGKRLKIVMIADKAGPVAPGGIGTLEQLNNKRLLEWLRERAGSAQVVMSVCSGSAILAKAGLLDGKKATCNKRSFRLLTGPYKKVDWVKEARWVDEGNRVTSSGVSAGIDMALHMVDRLYGDELAQRIADGIEHEWHRDAHADPFARFAK